MVVMVERRWQRMTAAVAASVLIASCSGSGSSTTVHTSVPGDAGRYISLTPTTPVSSGELARAASILNDRLRLVGFPNVVVKPHGTALAVLTPTDPAALDALRQVSAVGALAFRLVLVSSTGAPLEFAGPGPASGVGGTVPCPAAPAPTDAGVTQSPPAPPTTFPAGPLACADPSAGPALTPDSVLQDPASVNQDVVLPQYTGKDITVRYALGPVIRDGTYLFTGEILSSAQAQIDATGVWSVEVNFTTTGGSEWDKIVGGQYYQQYVAIVLDNRVESAPQIEAQKFGGSATISGGGSGFTKIEAEALAAVLGSGTLPVGLTFNLPGA